MPAETVVAGGIVTFLVGVFSWLFKTTATKAEDAMANTESLGRRVDTLEEKVDTIQAMEISVAELRVEMKNVVETLKTIEAHILRKND